MNKEVRAYHLMSASLAAHQCRFDELPESAKARIKDQTARAMLMEQLVLASDEARSVVIPVEVLAESVASIKARYETEHEFVADLARNGLTELGLSEALARELKADATLEKVTDCAPKATNAEARDWFAAHPEKFILGETREVRHILITINEDIPENRRAVALGRMTDVRAQLAASPDRFGDLALRYSECPSAMNGGTLGRVPRGRLYANLDAVLFDMPPNSLSDVLESEAGFHILLCERIYPAESVCFEDAAAKIKKAIDTKRQDMAQKSFIASLLQKRASERKAG